MIKNGGLLLVPTLLHVFSAFWDTPTSSIPGFWSAFTFLHGVEATFCECPEDLYVYILEGIYIFTIFRPFLEQCGMYTFFFSFFLFETVSSFVQIRLGVKLSEKKLTLHWSELIRALMV